MKSRITLMVVGIFLLASMFCLATDLKWRSPIDINPVAPKDGDTVTFKCKLKSGGGPSTGILVEGRIDGVKVWSKTYCSFAADQIEWVEFTWSAKEGNHTVAFVVDPNGTTVDTNPDNNERSINFSVGSSGGNGGGINTPTLTAKILTFKKVTKKYPDFKLKLDPCLLGEVDLTVEDFKYSHRSGDIIHYTATIRNLGTKCVRKFEWKIKDDKGWEEVRNLFAGEPNWILKGGEGKTIIIGINKSKLKGFHIQYQMLKILYFSHFRVVVDPNNKIPESDESNNISRMRAFNWDFDK